ncbi:MAG: hypothetical protein AAFV53_39425 [Myxococcota bacterium]
MLAKSSRNPDAPAWVDWSTAKKLWAVTPGPVGAVERLGRLLRALSAYVRPQLIQRRLERLRDLGYIDHVPTAWQVLVAGHHQMLGTASEETRVFYEARGIHFSLHNLRRFIDEPASMVDPVGFFSETDAILHHIFQSTHYFPIYDMQVVRMHGDGVAELERQWALICAGEHPRQARYEALVEDPTYWDRLKWQIPAFLADMDMQLEPGRYAHVEGRPMLQAAMDQFKDLRGFCAYASRVKAGPWDAIKAYGGEVLRGMFGDRVPVPPAAADPDLLDPDIVARWKAHNEQA